MNQILRRTFTAEKKAKAVHLTEKSGNVCLLNFLQSSHRILDYNAGSR